MKNSMKILISNFVVATVISSPVFAEERHNHSDKNQSTGGDMTMGMMTHELMMAMHEHMQKMR